MGRGVHIIAAAGLALVWAAPSLAGTVDLTEVAVQRGETLRGVAAEYLVDPENWAQLLPHNQQLPRDPGAALPGMKLVVPTALLKREFRAGMLVYALGSVLARKRDTSDWLGVRPGILLHDGDSLRTLKDSRARVRFAGKSMLELEPDSLAILKRPRRTSYDLTVEEGRFLVSEASVFAKDVGFFPTRKDTAYSLTRVRDRQTELRVHQGELALRDAENRELARVGAGFLVRIPDGQRPSAPERFEPSAPAVRQTPEPPAGVESDWKIPDPALGVPVAAYRVQVSRDKSFARILVDRSFGAGRKVRLEELELPPGEYWMRAASIDLLGEENPFSRPKLQRVTSGP